MEKTRKERIQEMLKNGEIKPKKAMLQTSAKIAGLTAVASSIIVPAYTSTVQADEITNNNNNGTDNNSKKANNYTPSAKSNVKSTKSFSAAATYSNFERTTMRVNPAVQKFIDQVGNDAAQVAANNDLYGSVMIAQAILESAYGKSSLAVAPNYNLFGIKGEYNGQSVDKVTSEDDGKGKMYQITAQFRKYPSYAESFQDYANVLRGGPRFNATYYAGAWKSNTKSYLDATQALTGTYATDTNYAIKLNNLIKSYDLTIFDNGVVNGDGAVSITYYKVVQGDTLNKISKKYKTSVAKLKELNNLKNDLIYVNQKLAVKVVTKPVAPSANNRQSEPAQMYTVVNGDTLNGIASKYKTSAANLKAWNHLSTNTIHSGQKLIVKPATKTANLHPSVPTKTYSVKKGDTLWGVAQKQKVSVANLKLWNKLHSNTIYVGQKLVIKK